MHQNVRHEINMTRMIGGILFLFLFCSFLWHPTVTYAKEAEEISIGTIDYELYSMQLKRNNNKVVYYSTDKKKWNEVEGEFDADGNYSMDISWINANVATTIYFKGDVITSIVAVTLPATNTSLKVTFDKVDGSLVFLNADEAVTFEWRKTSDYTWYEVDMDDVRSSDSVMSFQEFKKELEQLRAKGAKIIVRLPGIPGTGAHDVGNRPSKEISVSITARPTAPNVYVNSKKLTINTTSSMEYYHTVKKKWVECAKTMNLSELASAVFFENGSKDATIAIRTAETETKPYSLTTYLFIRGQKNKPSIGDNSDDVTYYYQNTKLVLQFPHASAEKIYEYAIVKNGQEYHSATANWKGVRSSKLIRLSKTTAPEGSTIYIRFAGTAANTAKKIEFVLPSANTTMKVKY